MNKPNFEALPIAISTDGDTLRRNDAGLFSRAKFSTGYIVGIRGVELPADEFTLLDVYKFAEKFNANLVGYWFQNGIAYLDVVQHCESIFEAIAIGTQNSQIAIFDCENQNCFDIVESQTDEKAYFASVLRRYIVNGRDLVVISDVVDQYGNEEFIAGVELSNPESLRQFNVKYNPIRQIDNGIVQFCNSAQSQSRRENNVNGCDAI